MSKYLFLVNPAAGKGKGFKTVPFIQNYFNHIGNKNFQIILSKAPKHLTEIANKSCEQDFTHIIAVGGDGTVHEILNGLRKNSKIHFGLLPVGSGNDFARSLHLSNDIKTNLDLILSPNSLVKIVNITEVIIIDKSLSIPHKIFIANSLGVGFDALVAEKNQTNKIFNGLLSYIISVIYTIGHFKPFDAEIHINDNIIKGLKMLISIGNGKTSGGGFILNPDAQIDDNLLDICIIDSLTKFNMVRHLPKTLTNRIKNVKEVSLHRFTIAVIYLKKPGLVHADGEIISRNAVKISVKLSDSKLKVVSG